MAIDLIQIIRGKYEVLDSCLSEKGRRLWAASEAISLGRGGPSLVSKATKISRTTIHKGIEEIGKGIVSTGSKVRKKGGGRKKLVEKDPELLNALDALVEPTAKGDPENLLRWTSKSVRNLEGALKSQGFQVSYGTVETLLKQLEYSLQANKKSLEKASHEDRNAQFQNINERAKKQHKKNQPVISVDTKKKENIGAYKSIGKELCKKRTPIKVNTHDFPDARLGKVSPYGVYDVSTNQGWVSVGISSDTAEFAVNTIRTWWYKMGLLQYPEAIELMITADCGGSNGYRVRLWKLELQKFSDESGLLIHVCHFPPGTSKWNKIEHKMFSYISKNFRGKPLLTRETVVNLIANTTTKAGLRIQAVLDENEYAKGREVSDEEISVLNISGEAFHPEWNYAVYPRKKD
jgi:transposase